eukprot:SAG11_NODE_24160_length_377_cov_0.920863_1_plen_73_part_10
MDLQGVTWAVGSKLDTENLRKAAIGVSGPAVGHGLQIDGRLCTPGPCAHAGRLVLPFVCNNASASGSHGDRGC